MIFSKTAVNGSVCAELQFKDVANKREMYNSSQKQLQGYAGLIPRDIYQEFDNVTVRRMRSDDGDTFLNDLMPLSRSINVGIETLVFRQASDAGNARTSMQGQSGVLFDQVEYSYDGTIVPIHDAGFSRNFREVAAGMNAGFDALIDDQIETVATIRRKLVDTFLEGHRDSAGNFITVDGRDWRGARHDNRVYNLDLNSFADDGTKFDFTSASETDEAIKIKFLDMINFLRITNNCAADLTVYVSRQIMANWVRRFSNYYNSLRISEELTAMPGVSSIKETSALVDNEMMVFPLNGNVRPIVGMAVNTTAMPKLTYNDNHSFVTWCAIGWEVRTDFEGRHCALHALGND